MHSLAREGWPHTEGQLQDLICTHLHKKLDTYRGSIAGSDMHSLAREGWPHTEGQLQDLICTHLHKKAGHIQRIDCRI